MAAAPAETACAASAGIDASPSDVASGAGAWALIPIAEASSRSRLPYSQQERIGQPSHCGFSPQSTAPCVIIYTCALYSSAFSDALRDSEYSVGMILCESPIEKKIPVDQYGNIWGVEYAGGGDRSVL